LVAVAVIISVAVGLCVLTREFGPQAQTQIQTFQIQDNTTFHIDENGNAYAELVEEILPSYLADYVRMNVVGGTIGDFTIHGIGIENAKSMYLANARSNYAEYGWEMENAACNITGLNGGDAFEITITWKTSHLAYRSENKWRILLLPVDNQSFARESLNNVKDLQSSLSVISNMYSTNCQIYSASKTSYILPNGVNIANEGELLSAGTGSMDYGGGTMENITTYISTLEGRPAVVAEGQAIITPQLVTITPEEFLSASNFCPIDYTGIPPSYGFESFAAWASIDMKFGRERDSYSASFDGAEFDITPYQLLYYSAKEVVILAENSSEPLLSDAQPISVLSPDYESGVWSAFLKKMTENDYVALARNISDQIASTGRAPGSVDSPIGALRARDALFTFLRVISFYCDYGELPANITFAPSPTDNLTRDGIEIPASNAYFLLSTQYVITGTPRVNQIVSDMRQVIHDNNELAENLCGWVHENIIYPMPPPLGWFTSEEILDTREGKCLDKANLYLALTRTAGIPSRLVSGFLIFEQVTEPFIEVAGMTPDGRYIVGHAWTEVYLPPDGWVLADPTGNYFRTYPYENRIYSSVEETWQDVLASYEGTYGELI